MNSPMIQRRRILQGLAATGASVALPAWSQDGPFPSRPISMLCAFTAGGFIDALARASAQAATRVLGQNVVVENKPGAQTAIAANLAAKARPDGYTLVQFVAPMLTIPHMQPVEFDPLRDFSFIIGQVAPPFGVLVRRDSPYRSFTDLVAAARAKPDAISYGSSGPGTAGHIFMEELKAKTGARFLHVPFKGPEYVQSLMGGHIDLFVGGSFVPQVDGGVLRLLALASESRIKRYPDIPTARELGFPVSFHSPIGIAGPRGMSPQLVKTLHDAFQQAHTDAAYQATLDKLDLSTWYRNPADYEAWARERFAADKEMTQRLGLART